jgi:hypothetical protein
LLSKEQEFQVGSEEGKISQRFAELGFCHRRALDSHTEEHSVADTVANMRDKLGEDEQEESGNNDRSSFKPH